jgi:hypothetical protein
MGKLLWQPTEEQIQHSNMVRYMQFVNERYGKGFESYDELYRWSVTAIADFWAFEGGYPPLWNYLCWFGLALFFQWAYQRSGIAGNRVFSLHLLCAVLVFFTGLNLYYGAFP